MDIIDIMEKWLKPNASCFQLPDLVPKDVKKKITYKSETSKEIL